MKIAYLGGYWSTNIGNSFFDLTTMNMLKKCGHEVIFTDEQMGNHWRERGGNPKNAFNPSLFLDVDAVAVSGCAFSENFPALWRESFDYFAKKNIDVLFIGAGCTHYTKKEREVCRKILKKQRPRILISRDHYTYENLGDLAERAYDGIDSAFFLADVFKPYKTNLGDYIVLNFDGAVRLPLVGRAGDVLSMDNEPRFRTSRDPICNSTYDNFRRAHCNNFCFNNQNWSVRYDFKDFKLANAFRRKPIEIGGHKVIRTKHRTDSMWRRELFNTKNTYASDIPYTYFNLYANTRATFSNRVHACVATLAFGRPAMLFSKNPRSHLLEKFSTLKNITNRPVSLSAKELASAKRKQIAFLRRNLK